MSQAQQQELVRGVEVDVQVATRNLEASIMQLEGANAGVRAYQQAVSAERIKLREGISTIIDLVLTEERLMGARLAQTDARLAYFQGLAQLAYLTGCLPVDAGGVSKPLEQLLLKGQWDEYG